MADRLRLLGILFTALAICAGGLAIWDMHRRVLATARSDLSVVGEVLAIDTHRYLTILDLRLAEVIQRAGKTDALPLAMADATTRRFLGALTGQLPPHHAIAVFDNTGQMVNQSGDEPFVFASVADQDLFRFLRDHPEAGPHVDVIASIQRAGARDFVLTRRISAPNGRFLGLAMLAVDMDTFGAAYGSLYSARGIAVTLLRRDGGVMHRNPMPRVMSRTMPADSPWYEHVAAGGGAYRSSGYLAAVEALVSVHPLRDFPLVIDVSIPDADLLARWRQESLYIAIGSTVLAALLLALFWRMARQVRAQEQHLALLANAAQALRASEARLDRAQELAEIGSWELDVTTGREVWSRQLYRIFGLPPDAVPNIADLRERVQPADLASVVAWLADVEAGRAREPIEYRATSRSGEIRVLRVGARAEPAADGTIRQVNGTTQDITAQRLAEERQQVRAGSGARVAPVPLSLNTAIEAAAPLLRRTIGDGIDLSLRLNPRLGMALAEPAGVELALLALARAAHAAMPAGGVLTIATANYDIPEPLATLHGDLPSGAYVTILVSDTGAGLAEQERARIFHPGPAAGTAIRAAEPDHGAVPVLVRQAGGMMAVLGGPGQGTSFELLFPRAPHPGDGTPSRAAPAAIGERG